MNRQEFYDLKNSNKLNQEYHNYFKYRCPKNHATYHSRPDDDKIWCQKCGKTYYVWEGKI